MYIHVHVVNQFIDLFTYLLLPSGFMGSENLVKLFPKLYVHAYIFLRTKFKALGAKRGPSSK